MSLEKVWYEELPEQCPPSDAFNPDRFVCYRLCECIEPSDGDFLSHRVIFPDKIFRVPECQARSISVFQNPEDLDRILKLAIHKHKAKVKIVLSQNDGVAIKTGKDSHFSWWRSRGFDLASATGGEA